MPEFPETRESLILQVKDPANRIAWEEFAQIYRPIIYRIARTKGLQEADAQDLSQLVLMSVASAIRRYEKHGETVRFRHWLSRITRNAIIKALTRRPQDIAAGGSVLLDALEEYQQPNDATVELIELEERRELYRRAAAAVRTDVTADTWEVFRLTTIEGVGVEEASRQMNRSTGSIYAIRSRVMRRLKESVREIEDGQQ